MITFDQIQSYVNGTLNDLSEFCFLLGSAATPRFRPDSDIDIDIAVFWKNSQIDFNLKLRVMNELEDKLGRSLEVSQ
jgi:predicted nucleotidyltransferase